MLPNQLQSHLNYENAYSQCSLSATIAYRMNKSRFQKDYLISNLVSCSITIK